MRQVQYVAGYRYVVGMGYGGYGYAAGMGFLLGTNGYSPDLDPCCEPMQYLWFTIPVQFTAAAPGQDGSSFGVGETGWLV